MRYDFTCGFDRAHLRFARTTVKLQRSLACARFEELPFTLKSSLRNLHRQSQLFVTRFQPTLSSVCDSMTSIDSDAC